MWHKKNPITCKERSVWLSQRHGAGRRGIEWDFPYEDWIAWWKHHLGDDWYYLRGNSDGKYVMARHGDTGPYARWNVKCITMNENLAEAFKARGCKTWGMSSWKKLPTEGSWYKGKRKSS
jgi:hypothetical protein